MYWVSLERARLFRFLKQPARAEIELKNAIQASEAEDQSIPKANLMLGFLYEERGNATAADEAWRSPLRRKTGANLSPHVAEGLRRGGGLDGAITDVALACYSGASDQTIQRDVDEFAAVFFATPELSIARNGAVRLSAAQIKEMFKDPRGHEWVRRFVFREQTIPQLAEELSLLWSEYFLRTGSLSGAPTPEQQKIFVQLAVDSLSQYRDGRLNSAKLLQLALTWKGSFGPIGWSGFAAGLKPSYRASFAYVLGLRYARLGKPNVACDFFKAVLQEKLQDMTVTRLASEELAHAIATQSSGPPSPTQPAPR